MLVVFSTAEVEEEHAQEDEGKVDDFCLEVLFVEEEGSEEEGDDNAGAAYHRHDGNHGIGKAQRIEIDEVGSAEEEADEDDHPIPTKGCGTMMTRPPQQQQHDAHHATLVDVVPALHQHPVDTDAAVVGSCHEIFVVKGADGTQQRCQDN